MIASKEKSDADKERLLKDFVVIYVLKMLAEEFYAANLNKTSLLIKDDLFVLNPFISAPIGSWCDKFMILNLHNLSNERQTCNMQVLTQAFGIQEGHEGGDNRIVRDILEGHLVEDAVAILGLIFHDVIDSVVNVGDPEHQLLKLSLLTIQHILTVSQLHELRRQLTALLTLSAVALLLLLSSRQSFRFQIDVLIGRMLNIFEQSGILLGCVYECEYIHGIALEVFIICLVVHLCNPSDDIVIYRKHVDPKFNLSVFEELLEEVANFIQGKHFGLL